MVKSSLLSKLCLCRASHRNRKDKAVNDEILPTETTDGTLQDGSSSEAVSANTSDLEYRLDHAKTICRQESKREIFTTKALASSVEAPELEIERIKNQTQTIPVMFTKSLPPANMLRQFETSIDDLLPRKPLYGPRSAPASPKKIPTELERKPKGDTTVHQPSDAAVCSQTLRSAEESGSHRPPRRKSLLSSSVLRVCDEIVTLSMENKKDQDQPIPYDTPLHSQSYASKSLHRSTDSISQGKPSHAMKHYGSERNLSLPPGVVRPIESRSGTSFIESRESSIAKSTAVQILSPSSSHATLTSSDSLVSTTTKSPPDSRSNLTTRAISASTSTDSIKPAPATPNTARAQPTIVDPLRLKSHTTLQVGPESSKAKEIYAESIDGTLYASQAYSRVRDSHSHLPSKIEISPGRHLDVRGVEEAMNCYLPPFQTTSTTTVCVSCERVVHVFADADFVLCSCCQCVSPFQGTRPVTRGASRHRGGVSLGFSPEEWDELNAVAIAKYLNEQNA